MKEVVLAGLGIVLAVGLSFSMWRRMRAEFAEEGILVFSFWVAVAGVVGGVALKWAGWWGAIGGVMLTLLWFCRRYEWDAWEWTDYLLPTVLWPIGIMSGMVGWWVYFVGSAVGVIGLWILGRMYRNFSWYRSGRPGFVGLVFWMWWGVVETVVAISGQSFVYWAGLASTQWLAVIAIVVAAAVLYLRSGLRVGEELWRRIKTRK